ncbi:hypothetical protein RHSIM_Rhsim10G0148800 [Rhododendron simsii]|uniref:WRKY domain-containing protein n=1 Tax=Rhododendron simsii TaxID=118357 RepID=A0A834GG41_RHOSS|nr:hypothetical protein RHSIM_Rhsim10G0148800 [Rhododendron simsii]
MDHDHHHPQNPNPCDTHFSDNFDALPGFEFSDFLLLDEGSEEGFSPENMASSDNVIDGSIESVGASNKNGARKGKADQAGSRVAFKTKSDLEVMDDGYKWRKYGKKMVKNSPNPR